MPQIEQVAATLVPLKAITFRILDFDPEDYTLNFTEDALLTIFLPQVPSSNCSCATLIDEGMSAAGKKSRHATKEC
jgi:hypothetical protein